MKIENINCVFRFADQYGRWHVEINNDEMKKLKHVHLCMCKVKKSKDPLAPENLLVELKFADDIEDTDEEKLQQMKKPFNEKTKLLCIVIAEKYKKLKVKLENGRKIQISGVASKYKYEDKPGWTFKVNTITLKD
jgi:hypothetical protein